MQPFQYLKPANMADALAAMLTSASRAKQVLAGGTTLIDLMKLNVMRPDVLIDIGGLAELTGIDTSGDREMSFGALARMSDVANDPIILARYPVLSEALLKAASSQLRNVATLGGNIMQRSRCAYFRGDAYPCNKKNPGSGCAAIEGLNRGHAVLGGSEACISAFPGDLAIALVALDAQVDVQSLRTHRTMLMADLHRLPGGRPDIETELAPDELITRIRIPHSELGKASAYHKVRDRESFAFALASAAVALKLDGPRVLDARIVLGGVATKPWRSRAAEENLIDQFLTEDSARKVGQIAMQGAQARRHNVFKIELGAETVAEALMIAGKRA